MGILEGQGLVFIISVRGILETDKEIIIKNIKKREKNQRFRTKIRSSPLLRPTKVPCTNDGMTDGELRSYRLTLSQVRRLKSPM